MRDFFLCCSFFFRGEQDKEQLPGDGFLIRAVSRMNSELMNVVSIAFEIQDKFSIAGHGMARSFVLDRLMKGFTFRMSLKGALAV